MTLTGIAPSEWDDNLVAALAGEARGEGFTHIDRLAANWRNGSNRFDRQGEILLAAWSGAAVVAVGGLNIDPYVSNPRIGRVRHLYVISKQRRNGVGRSLVAELLLRAHGCFDIVRVRAAKGDAPIFMIRSGLSGSKSRTPAIFCMSSLASDARGVSARRLTMRERQVDRYSPSASS